MPRKAKKSENKEILQKEISSLLIANDKKLKPFIEIFEQSGENIVQKDLGTIFGVFEITDYSEDSAYIVNFLNSVIKKEYFSNPKRSAIDSFESSLNKINLALSEVAKHGNINWIGKLNSVLGIIESDNIHFSVCGNSKVLLIRKESIIDISDGLSSEESQNNPLKTFVDVSSGKLEENDKLIFTTNNVFEIFSLEEIKRGALRFSQENFIQFIKTALSNRLSSSGTIIIDVTKKTIIEKNSTATEDEFILSENNFNAFSNKTFEDIANNTTKNNLPNSYQDIDDSEEKNDYTDKKTGHIYIRGDYDEAKKMGLLENVFFHTKEKLTDAYYDNKPQIINSSRKLLLKLKKLSSEIFERTVDLGYNLSHQIIQKIKKSKTIEKMDHNIHIHIQTNTYQEKQPSRKLLLGITSSIAEIIPSITPSFKKIKNAFYKLDYPKRIYSLLLLVFIIFIPYFIIKMTGAREKENQETIQQTEMSFNQDFSQEKNIQLSTPYNKTYSRNEKIDIFLSEKNNFFVISSNKIGFIENHEKSQDFSLNEEWGFPLSAAYMKDLNLLFILTNKNKLLSFSPISKKIFENQITIPNDSNIVSITTYMTYIYLLDSKNNQIYRYPRTDGGFGNPTNWMKDGADFSEAQSIFNDDNIYVLKNKMVEKYFRGERQALNLERGSIPVNISSFYTESDMDFLFVLDGENGRVIKYNKDGSIVAQFQNNDWVDSREIQINKENGVGYILTNNNNIVSFEVK